MRESDNNTQSRPDPHCSWCGDILDEEEQENPRGEDGNVACDDDDVICDDCYREEYEFTCWWCENYGKTEDQHNMLLVLEREAVRIEGQNRYWKPGVYQIIKRPYYGSDYFDSWILGGALVWLCDLPAEASDESYPSGHLCLDCQNRIWEQVGAKPPERK